jgi:hypothetical protein
MPVIGAAEHHASEFEKDSAVSREVPLDKKLYGWQRLFGLDLY